MINNNNATIVDYNNSSVATIFSYFSQFSNIANWNTLEISNYNQIIKGSSNFPNDSSNPVNIMFI